MTRSERPVGHVPRLIVVLLAASLACQVSWKVAMRPSEPQADDLPSVARPEVLRIAAIGEYSVLARVGLLYLQAFDYHGSNALPYRKLDYNRLIGWLTALQSLNELSEYPLFLSARVYAEVPDSARQRLMLEHIYEQFQRDPNRRWQWVAHAALVAKHQLKDNPLALKYARAVDKLTTTTDVPLWARQMEIFILEDMNEIEAAKIMLGGLLQSGKINDPGERAFLENRLKEMATRSGAQPR
jgi:hypothetical protein